MKDSKRDECKYALNAAFRDLAAAHCPGEVTPAGHAQSVLDCTCDRGVHARVITRMIQRYSATKAVKKSRGAK